MKKSVFLFIFTIFCSLTQAAELFVKLNAQGRFFAVVGEQSQFNPNNQFRFFDLYAGQVNLQIMNEYNNQIVFNGYVQLENNKRLVIEIDPFGNITKSTSLEIVVVNWYDSYIKKENNSFPSNGTSEYTKLLSALTETSFDSKRLELAKKYADKSTLTVAQIAEVAQKFTFDSNRLEWTKYAYHRCSNKENYEALKPEFTYVSNFKILQDYIAKQ